MVITILEARLPKEKWTVLEQAYENAIQQLDKGIVNTFLAQDAKEPDLWRIIRLYWCYHQQRT